MGISRQQAVRLPGRPEIAVGINESSRDRSSSAPNIYEITKDETLRETVYLRIMLNIYYFAWSKNCRNMLSVTY